MMSSTILSSASFDPVVASRSICIVDDDPAVRLALSLLAQSYGWTSCSYGSGTEFLAAWEADEVIAEPSCVVVDYHMPGLDGEQVVRRLRQKGAQVPILAVTADAQAVTRQRLLGAGADWVLAKPITDTDFEHVLNDCIIDR